MKIYNVTYTDHWKSRSGGNFWGVENSRKLSAKDVEAAIKKLNRSLIGRRWVDVNGRLNICRELRIWEVRLVAATDG